MATAVISIMLLTAILCLHLTLISGTKSEPLITITDDNWHSLLEGEWMVEFMAPWCPACRSFKTTWQSLADWSKDLDIGVGIVDVTENPGLSGRFLITSLPTIYHVKDGVFRVYQGARKESDLLSFVDDKKWQDVEPVSSWIHPSSFLMGMVGFFFRFAMVIRGFYTTMTTVYGIPEWGCYLIFAIGTIITGLLFGLLFVLCCDWLYPAKHSVAPLVKPSSKKDDSLAQDQDDESDLLDDLNQQQASPPLKQAGDNVVRKRQTQSKDPTAEETTKEMNS